VCNMTVVGVRELRQNASLLLEQVAAGNTVDITNHGRLVARLVPVDGTGRTREDLLAQGVLRPARGSILDVAALAATGSPSTSELLVSLRDDR
jgi:prevent-host-death family protein